ncbi:MAG: hypothetical protein RI894_525 [Bacteroidota bacterium]|jgi:hypothetical protein
MQTISLETLVTSAHPNELFRFVNLRNPIAAQVAQEKALFFSYRWDWATDNPDRFLHTLQNIRANGQPWTDLQAAATDFAATPNYISGLWQLDSNVNKLRNICRFLDKNRDRTSFASDFSTQLSDLLQGQTVADFLADGSTHESEFLLWDNVLVALILNNPHGMLLNTTKYLTALHLLKQYADAVNAPRNDDLIIWYNAQLLLSDWVYEVFSAHENIEKSTADMSFAVPAIPANTTDEELDFSSADFIKFEGALADLYLHSGVLMRYADLSPATKTVLQTLGIDTNPFDWNVAEKRLKDALYNSLQDLNIDLAYQKTNNNGVLCNPPYQNNCAESNWQKVFNSPYSFYQSAFIGDLHKTVSQLINFDLGEIAHNEAVLKGETKRRVFTRLDRTELTMTTDSEHSEEKELDTTTDDRFSMERETSAVLSEQNNLSAGVSVSGEYGVPATGSVSASAHLDYSQSSSQENSSREATQFSRQVTSRAVSRVKDRVRTTKSLRVIHEVKDETEHSIVNFSDKFDTAHINGVYRYIDKIYLNRILNYGKRLMLEFMIPEPANYFLFSKLNRPTAKPVLQPIAPHKIKGPDGKKLANFHQITETNYVFWAQLYGASDVALPPAETKIVSTTTNGTKTTVDTWYSGSIEGLSVPEGYEATYALLGAVFSSVSVNNNACYILLVIGTETINVTLGGAVATAKLGGLTGNIPMTYRAHTDFMGLNIVVHCRRTKAHLTAWKQETFNKITTAYQARKNEFAEQERSMDDLFGGQKLGGDNPLINRETELTELKRRVIELYTGQRFESFSAAISGNNTPAPNFPEILFGKSHAEGSIVKFFEEIFEWKNTTYSFYPYFWGRKSQWVQRQAFTDSDPIFQNFLQAGYARVVVPVTPGMERLLMLFNWRPELALQTGASMVWSVGVENPLHTALCTELYHAHRIVKEEEAPIIGSYIEKVPTNLVYLVNDLKVTNGEILPELPKYPKLLDETLKPLAENS